MTTTTTTAPRTAACRDCRGACDCSYTCTYCLSESEGRPNHPPYGICPEAPPAVEQTAAAILTEAADRISSHAWHQGAEAVDGWYETEYNDPRAVAWCAVGAMKLAADRINPRDDTSKETTTPLYRAELAVVAAIPWDDPEEADPKHPGPAIAQWNDEPGRTAEEVAAVLRKAAAELSV